MFQSKLEQSIVTFMMRNQSNEGFVNIGLSTFIDDLRADDGSIHWDSLLRVHKVSKNLNEEWDSLESLHLRYLGSHHSLWMNVSVDSIWNSEVHKPGS